MCNFEELYFLDEEDIGHKVKLFNLYIIGKYGSKSGNIILF